MKYHEQIKHPLWQKKRLEVLGANRFECENCGSKEDTLHVHHPYYKRNAMIWDYENEELQCLCNKCHKNIHALDEKIKSALSLCGSSDKNQILGYIDAIQNGAVLRPDTYEYCMGVADWISAHCKSQKEINKFEDKIMGLICDNKEATNKEATANFILNKIYPVPKA